MANGKDKPKKPEKRGYFGTIWHNFWFDDEREVTEEALSAARAADWGIRLNPLKSNRHGQNYSAELERQVQNEMKHLEESDFVMAPFFDSRRDMTVLIARAASIRLILTRGHYRDLQSDLLGPDQYKTNILRRNFGFGNAPEAASFFQTTFNGPKGPWAVREIILRATRDSLADPSELALRTAAYVSEWAKDAGEFQLMNLVSHHQASMRRIFTPLRPGHGGPSQMEIVAGRLANSMTPQYISNKISLDAITWTDQNGRPRLTELWKEVCRNQPGIIEGLFLYPRSFIRIRNAFNVNKAMILHLVPQPYSTHLASIWPH